VLFSLTALGLIAGASVSAEGQKEKPYPSRSIEIVVPSGAGGGQDTMVRVMQPLLEKELGTSIRVSNVPGGAHTKGILYAKAAPADGYLIHCESPSGLIADIFNKMPFRFSLEFVPIARIQQDSGILWIAARGASRRFRNDRLRETESGQGDGRHRDAGGVDDASVGTFAQLAGVEFAVVPIESGGERMASVIAGHVDLMYEEASAVGDMVKSGDLRPLVVFKDKRIDTPELKNTPCAGELGIKGMDALGTWRGFAVRKETPKAIQDRLTAAFKKVYDSPEYQKWAKENVLDLTPGWMGQEEFASFGRTTSGTTRRSSASSAVFDALKVRGARSGLSPRTLRETIR
jgi:tripartite-type tricarboxylate transporter receptor subunit TctC